MSNLELKRWRLGDNAGSNRPKSPNRQRLGQAAFRFEQLEPRTLLTGLAWSSGAPLPAARGAAAAIDTGAGVLLFGGATNANGTTTPSSVYQFDPFGNSWSSAAAADRGRNAGGVGATGQSGPISTGGEGGYKYATDIFLFGGANQNQPTASVLNYAYAFDTESVVAPSMSTARYRLAYATDPSTGDLYAIGGLNSSNEALASVEQYDPQADAWSTVAPLPQAVYGASAASDGAGHILVFGGYNSAGTPINTVYSYTLTSNAWTAEGAMPKALAGTAAVFGAYGQIYVIGGRTASGAVSDVSIYNPVTDQWTAETPLPAAEYGTAALIDSGGSLDVIGGFNSAGAAVSTLYQSIPLPAPVGLPSVPSVLMDGLYATYDGTSHAVIAGAFDATDGTPVDGTFSITYDGSDTPPVNAGTYNILATFTSNDANYVDTVVAETMYIDPATPTITLSGGGTITYDGLPHPITATSAGVDGLTPVSGQFDYTYNGSTSQPVNPGTYTAVANFTSADSNYTAATASTTITIPDPTIPTGVTAAGASTNSIRVSWNPVSGAAYYNVYERVVIHDPKGSGSTIHYSLVAGNVAGTSAVITVSQVKGYTFYVTSVSGTGAESPRSAPATGEPLFAPSLYSMFWNGAVTSYASVQTGQTLQVTLLGYGNEPPTYTMTSGPPTMTVDPVTGIVTYTPGPMEAGPVSATFQAANSLGTASATFQFQVLSPPVIALTVGAGAPNFTTNWFNGGAVPIENMAQATVTDPAGLTNLQSLTVTLATFHTGDVLSVPILSGISLTANYAAGTLTLSGSETLAHYQQELRQISYNNTNGGPGVTSKLVTFVASDGTLSSIPVTATVNVTVASGQVLGNRLFYNNSKYDVNNGAINASDDAAIASDKFGYQGTGTANFTAVSGFTRGITGLMVDLASGLGNHGLINLTSGDVTFKVAPAFSASYNQLSTWSAAPTPANISVRMGAGTSGSDRLEIVWANGSITDTWLEVDVKATANTGLSADDVFYFGSSLANSGLGDTAALARTDTSDYASANNNMAGLTTAVWNLVDYTKDGRVDISDANAVTNNLFTLHYIANPTGPFAPDGGGAAAAPAALAASSPAAGPSASGAVSSGLASLVGGNSAGLPPWLAGRLQNILSSPPVTKILGQVAHNPQILHAVDQIAAKFHADDALEALLADLGLG